MGGINSKNYHAQGGERWVVGGEIDIINGGVIKRGGVDITPQVDAAAVRFISYQVEDLAADGDIAARPIFVVPAGYQLTLLGASVISQGVAAGVDDANTCVVSIANGSDAIASKTYNTGTAFPADGAADSLGALDATHKVLAAGEVLNFSVTNGATANPPSFLLQITGKLSTV